MDAQSFQPFALLVRLASQRLRGCRNAGAMMESGIFMKMMPC
jgi:hypothetical protein